MPIYEYTCPTCGPFEEMRKFSDAPLTACPRGHAGVERKISAGGFILKGSGWYATDYARKGTGGAAEGGKSDAAGAKPSGEGKASGPDAKKGGDTKPAPAGTGS
jgi:putative FmdB family regulatory protein